MDFKTVHGASINNNPTGCLCIVITQVIKTECVCFPHAAVIALQIRLNMPSHLLYTAWHCLLTHVLVLLKTESRVGLRCLGCLISALEYVDGRDDDSDAQQDEGVLCCQGARVLLQEKLTNWLQGVLVSSAFSVCVCVCVCLLKWTLHRSDWHDWILIDTQTGLISTRLTFTWL